MNFCLKYLIAVKVRNSTAIQGKVFFFLFVDKGFIGQTKPLACGSLEVQVYLLTFNYHKKDQHDKQRRVHVLGFQLLSNKHTYNCCRCCGRVGISMSMYMRLCRCWFSTISCKYYRCSRTSCRLEIVLSLIDIILPSDCAATNVELNIVCSDTQHKWCLTSALQTT